MNKNYFCILCFLLILNIAPASADDAYQAPLVKDSMLLDVIQSERTIVVGERGHILVGDGNALTQAQVPTTVTLTAVDGVNHIYVAVGHDAAIVRSADAGETWEVVFSNVELDRPFLDVLFIDDKSVIAVGGYGMFYRSDDAGMTWRKEQYVSLLSPDDVDYLDSIKDDEAFYQEELNFIFPHFNRLYLSEGNLFLAGEAGLVAKSTDGGRSWKRLEIDYYGSFFDVGSIGDTVIALGLRGNMFSQVEEGDWREMPTCVTTSLNTLAKVDEHYLVLGNNGVVFQMDPNKINDDTLSPPNDEGCQSHSSLTQLESDISSGVMGAFKQNSEIVAVSADGLQNIELAN